MSILQRSVSANLAEVLAIADAGVLRQLVLDVEMLRQNQVRASHPRLHWGWLGYSERTALLRERLDAEAWDTLEDGLDGVETLDGRFRIVTAAGDASTGRFGGRGPSTSAKGVCTQDAVSRNRILLLGERLPEQLALIGSKKPPVTCGSRAITVLLLVHRDGENVRAELSIPIEMTTSGSASHFEYAERHLLVDESLARPMVIEGDMPPAIEFDVGEL